jgi:hypothetical protein
MWAAVWSRRQRIVSTRFQQLWVVGAAGQQDGVGVVRHGALDGGVN